MTPLSQLPELLSSVVCTYERPFTQSSSTPFSLNWRGTDSIDRWTIGWIRNWLDGNEQLNAHMEMGDKWCPSGLYWNQCCFISPWVTETMGLSAPSASLQAKSSWEVQDGMKDPPGGWDAWGTWTRSRSGCTGTSWVPAHGSGQSLLSKQARLKWFRAALPRRTWG